MLSVESFNDRFLERPLAGIIDHHADPRDGLQQTPMKAERHAQQEHQHPFCDFRQHYPLEYQAASELSTGSPAARLSMP